MELNPPGRGWRLSGHWRWGSCGVAGPGRYSPETRKFRDQWWRPQVGDCIGGQTGKQHRFGRNGAVSRQLWKLNQEIFKGDLEVVWRNSGSTKGNILGTTESSYKEIIRVSNWIHKLRGVQSTMKGKHSGTEATAPFILSLIRLMTCRCVWSWPGTRNSLLAPSGW